MAAGAQNLPKWQAIANLVPQKKYFFHDFFSLTFKYGTV
jgi:hypothetical protein